MVQKNFLRGEHKLLVVPKNRGKQKEFVGKSIFILFFFSLPFLGAKIIFFRGVDSVKRWTKKVNINLFRTTHEVQVKYGGNHKLQCSKMLNARSSALDCTCLASQYYQVAPLRNPSYVLYSIYFALDWNVLCSIIKKRFSIRKSKQICMQSLAISI